MSRLPFTLLFPMLLTSCTSPGGGDPTARPTSQPTGAGSSSFPVPTPDTFRLSNGLEVWHFPSDRTPLVHVSLILRSGSTQDPPGKEGLAALTADLLDEGAGSRSALELADEIDYLGAELSIDLQKEHMEVSIEALDKNLPGALDLFADVVLRPRFEEKEWTRVKALALNDLAQRQEEARDVARVVSERVFYGDSDPYAHPVDGYVGSVKALELEDLKRFRAEHFRPDRGIILAAGAASRASLQSLLEARFGTWKAEAVATPAARTESRPAAAAAPGARLFVVDRPEAPQTEVRILLPAPAYGAPELPALSLANTVLGGTFTSRLVTNLRERNGFTYGASSLLLPRAARGQITMGSAIATPKTGAALIELWKELLALETGSITPEERQKTRATHQSRLVESLETLDSTLKLFLSSAAHAAGPTERQEYFARLAAVTDADMEATAHAVYRFDRATIVLVGDATAIREQLAQVRAASPSVEGRALDLPEPVLRGREGEELSPAAK